MHPTARLLAVVLFLAAVAGCGESSSMSGRGGGGSGTVVATNQQRAEILVGTMETLFSLEEYELGQAEQLVMSRLNQWLRGQEVKTPWQREARLDALPPPLAGIRAVQALGDNSFLYQHDFAFLREAVWMHRIAKHLQAEMFAAKSSTTEETSNDNDGKTASEKSPWQFVSSDDPEELRLAMQLFDWTTKHVQLEEDAWPTSSAYKLPRHWHTPYETVLLGRGTASDRAWTFILLARQLGLDVVMLGLANGAGETNAGADTKDDDSQEIEPAAQKPWIPALVLTRGEGDAKTTELYLFDPALGLPIPGPEGRGIATLAQVAADDALLRQLDLDDKRPYPVKAADVQEVTALVEASPGYLSQRMQFLESRLGGNQRIVLSVSADSVERKLADAAHVRPRAAIWTRPYETLRLRQTEDETLLGAAQAELYPLEGLLRPVDEMASDRKATSRREDTPEWGDPQRRSGSRARVRVPLGVGRMLQLAGDHGHESGALRYLQQAMASEADQGEIMQIIIDDLRARLPRPDDPATQRQIQELAVARVREFRRADQAAKLWIGQIKAAAGEYATAISYFTSWENPVWQPSLNYSLARVYEAQGKPAEAIRVYREDDSPQRPGNLLRARRLEKLIEEE